MENIAPDIVRQRLLIEGYYSGDVTEVTVKEYLQGLAAYLNLRHYGEAIIHSPEGMGKAENEGFDAFLPLIDSGISLYVWSQAKFFAVVLFTCKAFDENAALEFTQTYFSTTKLVHKAF